jgi:type I restriction enzyme S subunit
MKNTWERVPIKSVYLGLYDGPHATPKPSKTGPVFLGIKNLTEDGHFNFSEVRHIAEEDFPK